MNEVFVIVQNRMRWPLLSMKVRWMYTIASCMIGERQKIPKVADRCRSLGDYRRYCV